MRSFEFAPLVLIILLTVVLMGALGLFVFVPIGLIEWGWNLLARSSQIVPPISAWQAFLLYIACGLMLYVLGLVKIEFRVEKVDP